MSKVIKTIDAAPFHNATYTLYDKFDRQIATYDATKHQTSASQYDSVDRVITSTDTFSQTTNYSYAADNLHTTTTTPTGVIVTDTFDAANRRTRSDETASSVTRTTKYDYDQRNRQLKITDANGGTTDYAYYNDGQTLSIEDAVHNLTKYFYDIAGRLTHENSPLGDRYYQYDKVNNRTQTTDRNGRQTDYTYDNLNRLKSEQWLGDGQTFTYSYDQNGNRIGASDGNINYVYGYDRTDLLERVDRTSGSNPLVSFKYTYDEIGNLTKTEELIANAPTATTLYEYDDPRYLNTKITQTIGLVQKDVKFAYNPATGLNTTIERYVDGLLKVVTTNAYDTHGRLTGIEHKDSSGAVIANDIYVLDDLDRVRTQTLNGAPRTIGYDNTDQVLSVTGSNTEGYTYDLNGNRINTGYVTVSGNRLLSDGTYSYDYDPEGNRTSRTKIVDSSVELYTWDYRNRLKSIVSKTSMTGTVTRTVGYEYDVDDQRVSKQLTVGSGQLTVTTRENYYLDGNQIAFVTDGSGNETFHYLYGLNIDQVLAQDSFTLNSQLSTVNYSGMVWALADRLGSVDTLTDSDGVVVNRRNFDSFGRVLSETNPSVQFRYGYTGRELDLESGLNYYRARYYDTQVGRFISVDPMGFGAGDTNLYRYVGNNSTNATDPSGLYSFDDFGRDAGNFGQGIGRNFDYSFDAINTHVFSPVGNAVVKPVVNAVNTNFITPFNDAASNAVSFYTNVVNEGQREGGVVGTLKQGAGIFAGTFAATPGAVGSFVQNNAKRIGGLFQAIGGAGEIYAGATTSATIFGAPVGVPLVANGVDNFQAGLRKLFTGEDANTLLYDATKRLTGSDKLAGTVDAATGLVLNAAAASAAAKQAADRALAVDETFSSSTSRLEELRAKYGKLTKDDINDRINLRGATRDHLDNLIDSGLSKREIGPVVVGVLDRITGKMYFGINSLRDELGKAVFPANLHEELSNRILDMPGHIRDGYKALNGLDSFNLSIGAGTHAEVFALNQGLNARAGSQIEDFLLYGIKAPKIASRKSGRLGTPIARCPHCDYITNGVQYFPQSLNNPTTLAMQRYHIAGVSQLEDIIFRDNK